MSMGLMQIISFVIISAVAGQRFRGLSGLPKFGTNPGDGSDEPASNLEAIPGFGSLAGALPSLSLGTNPLGSGDILNPMNAGKKFVATLLPTGIPLVMDSLRNVPAVPKNPAGSIPAASIDDVKKNFISSYMPFCPAEKIAGRDCICKETYPHVEYIEDKGTRTSVVVAINAKFNQIVVSYRLTDNLQNWIDDFKMQPIDVAEMPKGVRVHRGIYSNLMGTYNQVRDSVTVLLDDPRYQNHTLFITGYSLGGGMGQLSIPSWYKLLDARNDPRPLEAITYSNPRVGNRVFADFLESLNIPITRSTNQNDLVSHLPGRKPGFVHAGAEVYGSKVNGQYILRQCSQAFDEDPTCVLGTFSSKSPIPHATPMGKMFPLPPYC
ncbi:hypothetical protein DSO57_1001328 [Entomophthora muscae]|uniref:Uncharacterized protein n=1 Tax=Entomophthora muscae TaxID=34485 RepID=A0ACC2U7M1_9FUNG|nr:hypothetical protein DSO57_1001328 [Entomophthora muscae]